MWSRYGWLLLWIGIGAYALSPQCAVVINEIMYNPSTTLGDDSDYEFIELVNTGSVAVPLTGWSFTSGTFFTFPAGTTIEPHGYLVVCANQDSVQLRYGITNTVGNFTNRLNDAGELIRLVDNGSATIDEVTYMSTPPWSSEPGGNGPSLELINYEMDNSLATSWAASDSFGTPGIVNSVFVSGDTIDYYSIYFSNLAHTSFARESVANSVVDLSDPLTDIINGATSSLDLCAYNLTDPALTSTIIAAHNRGVLVRFITDDDHHNTYTASLESAGITVIDDAYGPNSGSGYMHNKFAVADFQGAGDSVNIVWTGSYNWSLEGATINANNGIALVDSALAAAYTAEFNEMWGSSGATPNSTLSRFGSRKTDNITHIHIIDEDTVEVYMSPGEGINTAIIDAIETADHEIAFCILAFTRTDIMFAMKDKWDDDIHYPDFMVEGVFDNANAGTSYSQWHNMSGGSGPYPWSPPADVWIDGQPSGLLHHKYMVIDGNHPESNPIVITGSANWSNNAVESNDENIVIIHNADVANQYLQEFYARKSMAMGNLPPIYDVQFPQSSGSGSPYAGTTVTITGVVTANFPDVSLRRYMVQGPYSAPWWGIFIYQSGTSSNFVVGDSISVRGSVQEYYELTEITSPNYTDHGTAEIIPVPLLVTTGEVASTESLESVLVQVENVTVVSEMNPSGEWQIDDGTGVCTVDDMGSYTYVPQLGDEIAELRGVVYYGSGDFKLEPRDDNDIVRNLPGIETLTIRQLGAHALLEWESLGAGVLYRIYRDTNSDFVPSPTTLVDSTTSTSWLDINALSSGDIARFYRITGEN